MERLKQLRGEKGLTQQEVSDAVGVARETYARYESGARTPDIDMLSRLADLFGVTTDYLLGRTDIPNAYIHEGIKLPGILYSTQKDLPPEDQEQVQELVQRALEDGQNVVTLRIKRPQVRILSGAPELCPEIAKEAVPGLNFYHNGAFS
jgi:transcriptional regulator with XRE-family HTH domain